ncbi:MAG: VanZ family protein [Ignavibacteriae bacterium]|nr:VanZ family protein [Ignavibacteria bacterium]MBI3365536.1 VanZ family protein [Ignavibacteriota bacterium]
MGVSRSSFVRYRLPAILWAMLIFIGSSIPAKAFPMLKIFDFDKLIHVVIFFGFGTLVYRALAPSIGNPTFSWRRAIVAILVVGAYGILDEFHQSFVPGRTPDIWDATADTIGGIVSVISIYIYYRWKSIKPQTEA